MCPSTSHRAPSGGRDVDEPSWLECASVAVNISPTSPEPLFGFAHRVETNTGVRSVLEANVVATRDSAGAELYLVSVDLLYGGDVEAALQRRLAGRNVVVRVFGSHTHFAPGVDSELPLLGVTSPGYVDYVAEQISLALSSVQWHRRVEISAAEGRCDGLTVNRRRPILGRGLRLPGIGRVVMAPHPEGNVDPTITVATIQDADGNVRAVLWSVACHPVYSPEPELISACFPGQVREALRAEYGDIPVIYLQGFSGDVNPWSESRIPPKALLPLGQYIVAGFRRFEAPPEPEYDRWCRRMGDAVLATCQAALDAERSPMEQPSVTHVTALAESDAVAWRGGARSPHMTLVTLTRSIAVFLVNAEPVGAHLPSVRQALPHKHVLAGGCQGRVIGYWPTDEMLEEGGYEGCRSQRFFVPIHWSAVGGPDRLWHQLFGQLLAKAGLRDERTDGSTSLG